MSTTPLPRPVDGWSSARVDPAVFGDVWVMDAVEVDGAVIAVGCARNDRADVGFPLWRSDDGVTWAQMLGPNAVGPRVVNCLEAIIDTEFGTFAHGAAAVWSQDGVDWEPANIRGIDEIPFGWVEAMFVSDGLITALVKTAGEAESTSATLVSSADGRTWAPISTANPNVFDNGGIGDTLTTKDEVIAVGAVPWGEFVPTAAVWTSISGVKWELVTPRGPGFEDAYMNDVVNFEGGFVAVGGNPFDSNLMAAWTSEDGVVWVRAPSPTNDVAAEHGYMDGESLSVIGGVIYASGFDFDAARSSNSGTVPALWSSPDGLEWTRADLDTMEGLVPFTTVQFADQTIGFWPPPRWKDDDPVQVFVEDS